MVEPGPDGVVVYTDGAGNNGPGGWAWACDGSWQIPSWFHGPREDYGGTTNHTTNNRMELMAVIKARESIGYNSINPGHVTIASDSSYVVNCFLERWYVKWEENNWGTGRGAKKVSNRDLWEILIYLVRDPDRFYGWQVRFVHVKGHSGISMNEYVDRRAAKGKAGFGTQIFDESRTELKRIHQIQTSRAARREAKNRKLMVRDSNVEGAGPWYREISH